jgi:uncharacterized protein (TIGR00251 family)
MTLPATRKGDGVVLHVRLTPKSSAARIGGVEDHGGKVVLKAYVTTPPEDGKANAALLALVADWLGVSKSAVALASGQKSRLKSIAVDGEPDKLLEKISRLLAALSQGGAQSKNKGKAHG